MNSNLTKTFLAATAALLFTLPVPANAADVLLNYRPLSDAGNGTGAGADFLSAEWDMIYDVGSFSTFTGFAYATGTAVGTAGHNTESGDFPEALQSGSDDVTLILEEIGMSYTPVDSNGVTVGAARTSEGTLTIEGGFTGSPVDRSFNTLQFDHLDGQTWEFIHDTNPDSGIGQTAVNNLVMSNAGSIFNAHVNFLVSDTLTMQIGDDGTSHINSGTSTTGAASASDGLKFAGSELVVNLDAGFVPNIGDTFTIISGLDAGFTDTFASIDNSSYIANSGHADAHWAVTYDTVNGDVILEAVPEPSSMILAGLGLLGMAGFGLSRRRRRLA
ncbi:MAG: PEP-CTERM sorting domain-containing protein [Pirellulaceae bacterium]|nr:PEP-CTERM sorting domain-containing protein [Pirellulaceae bacterium]